MRRDRILPRFSGFIPRLLLVWILLFPAGIAASPVAKAPEPDPPAAGVASPDDSPGDRWSLSAAAAVPDSAWKAPAALVEWTYHKTGDNLHPDGNEQQLVWLMNRARSDPAREGQWLAAMTDPDVAGARSYFKVDLAVLAQEFAAISPKPPAAFDIRLYQAAGDHSAYLIAADDQSHDGQLTRVDNAGFRWTQYRGNVFSYSKSALYGHAAFNIDWGEGSDGTQDPPGHRYAIMSVDGGYTNVGIAVVPETSPSTGVGPQVITGNFCRADTAWPDHYNRFLVGTVWEDTNANSQYDPGEGLSGVTVVPDKGGFFAKTGVAGGYAIPVTAEGTYTVTFSGGELADSYTREAVIAATSVLLDLEYYAASLTPPPPVGDGTGTGGGGGNSGGGGGCFIAAAQPDGSPFAPLALIGVALLWLPALRRTALS
jgi:hypothetical protein